MVKNVLFVLNLILIAIVLIACGSTEEPKEKQTTQRQSTAEIKPPTMFISISDIKIEKVESQTYKWQYKDAQSGKIKTKQTDALPPTKTVSIEKPIKVKAKKYMKIGFSPNAIFYRVKLWDQKDNLVAKYADISEVEQHGTYIVEVEAKFEQGSANYFIPMTFPK